LDAKLSCVIRGKEWEWLLARSESLVNIQSKLPLIKLGVTLVTHLNLWLVSKLKSLCKQENLGSNSGETGICIIVGSIYVEVGL
jgi:hypothetical protein